jgi:arylsulfatase
VSTGRRWWPLALTLAGLLAQACRQGEEAVVRLAFETDTGRLVGEASLEWSPRELGSTTRPLLPHRRALLEVPGGSGAWALEFATGVPADERAGFRLVPEGEAEPVFFEVVDGGSDGRWVPRRVRLPRAGRYRLEVLPAGTWARRLARPAPDGACLSLPRLVPADAGPSGDRRPNLLLISADTLRADRLGCYGAGRPTSPEIDRLAAEGILVERAYAPSNWTLPSHYSLFAGLDPSAHGVDPDLVAVGLLAEVWGGVGDRPPRPDDGEGDPGRPSLTGSGRETTLAEVLRAAGYRTRAFTENGWVSARFGFHQGFDAYDSDTDGLLERTRERAMAWLRSNAERGPWFLFLHSYEVHQPYHAPEPFRSRFLDPDHVGFALPGALVPPHELNRFKSAGFPPTEGDIAAFRALYDAGVLNLDGLVGAVRRALEEAGVERRTIVVFTSDHGEELFERGGFDHLGSLHEEVARVPLIVWAPGRTGLPPGTRLGGGPVSLTDLGNTLLGLLGVPAERPIGLGRDLSEFLGPGASGGPLPTGAAVFAESRGESSEPVQAVWEDGPDGWWKYLRKETQTGVREWLYELRTDPGEARDLSGREADRMARLREALRQRRAAASAVREALGGGGSVTLDEESLEALRKLGYVP